MLYLIFATVVEKTYCQKSEHMVFTQTILTTLLDLDRPDGTTVRGGHMTKSSPSQVIRSCENSTALYTYLSFSSSSLTVQKWAL